MEKEIDQEDRTDLLQPSRRKVADAIDAGFSTSASAILRCRHSSRLLSTVVAFALIGITSSSLWPSPPNGEAGPAFFVLPASVSLTEGQSVDFQVRLARGSKTHMTTTSATWILNPAVGTVVRGVYTAPATILHRQTVTLTGRLSNQTATATITLMPPVLRNTPHFGNDGSMLTSYVPGKSIFVRSMFFSLVPNLAQYAAAFQAAQVNTVESGFYVPPGNGFSNAAQWESTFDRYVMPIETAAKTDGFNIILTGDDIAAAASPPMTL